MQKINTVKRLIRLLHDFAALTPNQSMKPTSPLHAHLRNHPRKDKLGFDLLSDVLPFGGLWYLQVGDAIEYAQHNSRTHDVVISVYDATGKLIEVHRHKGDFKEP